MLPTVLVEPPWPGVPYNISCPPLTSMEDCRRISSPVDGCFEPERETAEILNALLSRCHHSCTYVDVGCNLGLFAAQAAALGARAECYEHSPFFVDAVRSTGALNGFGERLKVFHMQRLAMLAAMNSLRVLCSTRRIGSFFACRCSRQRSATTR